MKRYGIITLLFVALTAIAPSAPPKGGIDGRNTDFANPGPFPAKTVYEDWQDTKRNRTVPIRITYGEGVTSTQPVVLFSHGLGGNRDAGSLWAEHWASHGFLVVHLQHPGSDESLWKGLDAGERLDGLRSGMTPAQLIARVEDVNFVLAELVSRQRAGEKVLARAELRHIGMAGHSFGAQTTQAVAGQKFPIPLPVGPRPGETRIVAAIAFSPNARSSANLDRQFGSITMPFLSLTGTKDEVPSLTNQPASDRLLPYQHMPAGGKILVNFEGADHMVLGGHNLRREATPLDKTIQEDVKVLTLAFWEAYLKDNAMAKSYLSDGSASKRLRTKAEYSSK
ncbi:MAG: hypothetical protein K1X53_04705 [Candidatus Sumerlaeaceae bacterium]|nr:hypothetical protein [Candidatus Sumerlaeaceae bacterium]